MTFEVADAESFAGHDYDLIGVFNALHEWGDPVVAARWIRRALAPDGAFMFTEPCADDELIPSVRARTYYAVPTFVRTPSALAQGADDALGAPVGETRLRRVVEAAGFGRVRRAAGTPSFRLLEARP